MIKRADEEGELIEEKKRSAVLEFKKEKDKAILVIIEMRRVGFILIFSIFVLAYFLRVMFLPQNVLTFGYDQARDAFVSQQIINGDFKILGPPASIPGLYHGVFYYYFLAPAYFLGSGNPIIAAYWIAFFNAAVVFIIFYLAFLMTRRWQAGLLAAFLFAISFESTQYATWLSNPTLGVWTVPLIYLGLWLWIKQKSKWGPMIAALGLGLSIQAELFLLYHIVPLGIWLLVAKKNITKAHLMNFVLVLLISLSTMILVEFKFGFKSVSAIKELALSSQDSLAYADSLGDYLILYLNQIGRIFAFNSYPGNIGYGGMLVLALAIIGIYFSFRSKEKIHWGAFLATWLFSHLTVVTVGGTYTPFLMVGIGPAVSVLIAIFLARWWVEKKRFLTIGVLAILIYGNLSVIVRENSRSSTLFAIQKDMSLVKELKAIDYTYEEARGEPFSVNTLTSPLWINNVWAYLYDWYGGPKYDYLPQWHGRSQIGQLADSILPDVSSQTKTYFLILEPMGGIPKRYLEETIGLEDTKSKLVSEEMWGELRVQKRERF